MKTSAVAALGLVASAAALPSLGERQAGPACADNFDGTFEITVFKEAGKRDIQKRACNANAGALILKLKNGVLTDAKGRTGYIASNYQFQFDGPPQANHLQTSGFSVCANGKLALDGKTDFYQCLSGNFNNLYDRSWAPQCEKIIIVAMSCGDGTSPGVTQVGDGQPQSPTKVTEIGDGQPQAPTKAPITQIGDGQIQAPTGAPITQIGDGQVQVPTKAPVAPPVTQIGDGQVQAPTAAPKPPAVTQIGDGQVQAPPKATTLANPVTQIGDGQVQAPTGAPKPPPVTQIGDGQVQAPTSAPVGNPVTQIGDGQVQAPTGTPAPVPAAGVRALPGTSIALAAAALGAIFYL